MKTSGDKHVGANSPVVKPEAGKNGRLKRTAKTKDNTLTSNNQACSNC